MRQASILARLGALKTKFDEDGPVKQLVLEHATLTAEDQAALESMSREDVRVFIVPFQLSINDVERLIDTMQADLDRRRRDQWQAQEAVDDARAKADGVKQLDMGDIPTMPDVSDGIAETEGARDPADF